MANNTVYKNSWPARRHATPGLHASAAAALANGVLYKGVVFMVTGSCDIVDAIGTLERITMPAGSVYPLQNYGVVTGGSLAEGEFALLFD